jgi:hypothetical protein
VRRDLLLDEGPHGRAKHVVLLVEDLHRPQYPTSPMNDSSTENDPSGA